MKNYNCKVHVVDAIMGSGKTSAAINYINSLDLTSNKVMYITPYLDQIERIKESCPKANFYTPKPKTNNRGGKFLNLKKLLKSGKNICTTHALFQLFDRECIELCQYHGYTLIMDEVAEVVSSYDIGKEDLDGLLKLYAYVEPETRLLRWREEKKDYHDSYYQNEKRLIDLESLCLYGNSLMIWMFPVEAFNAFKEIYILTYMFDGQIQRYYYNYYNLPYDFLYVKGDSIDNYEFTTQRGLDKSSTYNYGKLINILENNKLNQIGDPEYSLSKNWYGRQINNPPMKDLKKCIYNYFRNIVKSPSDDNLWTTYKMAEKKLKGDGYSRSFLSCNARATNSYSNRHNIAYVVNRYVNSVVKQFFVTHGIKVDDDEYALSEMLQFIWRSAIRNGEQINLYIPSLRMRNLLKGWIKKNSVPSEVTV